MPYALGIDLGSGHTTAALCRNDHERWSEPEVLALDGLASTESVLHLTDEGTVEVGLRALRQVVNRPDRVTRGFVDRVGDEIPIVLGGQPYPAEVLIAALVGWIVDYAEATEGTPASHLVVTHPAGWGSHRRATLLSALREVTLPELTLLPRPVAAAEGHAATERVEVGQEIAVHSLGAGRFEAAVLRRGSFGFELRAHADSAEPAGGDVFDDLLAAHVLAELDMEVEPVALAKLRASCRSAKERLSTEVAVTVPAPARSSRGTVMVNRTDLEELLRPAVEATVTSLRRTIQAAGTSTGSLRAVVLVGGCGRIPLVSELVSAGVRVRVAAAADPELSVARGAALAAARVAKPTVKAPALTHLPEPIQRSAVTHTDLMRIDELPEADVADVGPPPPRPPVDIAPLEPPRRRLLRLGTRGTSPDDEDLFAEGEPAPRRRVAKEDRPVLEDDRPHRLSRDDDYLRQLSADDAPRRRPTDDDRARGLRPTDSGPRPRGEDGLARPRRRLTEDVDRESLPAQVDYDLRSPRSREADRRNVDSDAGLAMSPIPDADLAPEPPRQRNASGPIRRREPAFDVDAGPRPGVLDAEPPRRHHPRRDSRAAEWPGEDEGPPYHLTEADLSATRRDSDHRATRRADRSQPQGDHRAHQSEAEVHTPPSRHTYRGDTDTPPGHTTRGADLPAARRSDADMLPRRPQRTTHDADPPPSGHTYQGDTDTPPGHTTGGADLPAARRSDADLLPRRPQRTTHDTEPPPNRHTYRLAADTPPAYDDSANLAPGRSSARHTHDPSPGRHEHRIDTGEAAARHQQSGRRHRYEADADVPPARHHHNASGASRHEQHNPDQPARHERAGRHGGLSGRHERANRSAGEDADESRTSREHEHRRGGDFG